MVWATHNVEVVNWNGTPAPLSPVVTPTGVGGGGIATTITITLGNNQSGLPGALLTFPLVVKVTDVNGVAVVGTTVTFQVTAGGGTLNNGTGTYAITTDSSGQAATGYVLDINTGTNTITASVGGVASPATFTETNSFAVPDLVNNASFEAGDSPDVWDGFTDWTGTQGNFPFGTGGGFNCVRTTAQAFAGTESVEMDYAAVDNQGIRMISKQFSGQLHLFYRVYFFIKNIPSTIPTQSHKWLRTIYTLVGCDGGLYLDSPGGDLSWANVESNPGNSHTPLKSWSAITQGVWHYIEVEYDRTNWNVSPGPRARFWLDGNVLVGGITQLSATSFWGDANGNANPSNGNGNTAYPWLYANGTAAASHPVIGISFDDTFNTGSTGAGTIYYDKVAVSTQRIGP